MDQLKRKRTVLRGAFTRAYNAFNEVSVPGAIIADVKVNFQILEEKMSELSVCQSQYMDLIILDASEEDLQKEYDEADEYRNKFVRSRVKFEEGIAKGNVAVGSVMTAPEVQVHRKSSRHWPEIELVKFSGQVREWLEFWCQFKKIHNDPGVDKEDKFQYLIQAMVPGSRAAELIRSYPPTSENYDKAVESLKNRFGRDDLLIEVYVRELLQLVLQNAMKNEKKMSTSSLYDKLETYLRALDSLGVTTDKCATMLFPLVESSLPEELLRVWQRSGLARSSASENAAVQSKDRLTQLIAFLAAEVESDFRNSLAQEGFLGNSEKHERHKSKERQDAGKKHPKSTNSDSKSVPSARDLLVSKPQEKICLFCDSREHEGAHCEKAKAMTLLERQNRVKQKRACYNCLKIGHGCKTCHVNVRCSKCSRRHVDIMCFDAEKNDSKSEKVDSVKTGVNVQREHSLANLSQEPQVFMQTLRVKLRSDSKEIVVRAVIDSGSQRSYITKTAADLLNYEPIVEQKLNHLLFGGKKSETVTHKKYKLRVNELNDTYACNYVALDTDLICEDIPSVTRGHWLEELKELKVNLSDTVGSSEQVSLLIGVDISEKLMTGRRHELQCGLIATETLLGWTLSGKVPGKESEQCMAVSAIAMCVNSNSIKDLWALDVLGIKDPIDYKSQNECEREAVQNLLKRVYLNADGRYEVPLPWKDNHPALNDNKEMAVRRLQSTLKKIDSLGVREQYESVLYEWAAEGVIEKVPSEEENDWGHYLPHRPVIKENSTTPIRPVFDASAKDRQFPALNECLWKGSNLIEFIPSVLLQFREGKVGVVADIKKAFLQISINPKDRDNLRFLWIDKKGNLIIFRHCRVVFGVCSSPFILGAIIDLHLKNLSKSLDENKIVKKENLAKLARSLYVDNCAASVNSEKELEMFMADAKTAMMTAGFDLRGWEFTSDGAANDHATVLGVVWNKESDKLSVKVSGIEELISQKISKRVILSFAHRVFDPLGFICPATLGPKILLQEACAAKLSWDDEVSKETGDKFIQWVEELKFLPQIQVPRCILGIISDSDDVTLHTFCDASKHAYATVSFLRVQRDSETQVRFVQAKSRVAPRGVGDARTSIPRLELLAATIGARLTSKILEALNLKNIKVYYWSDSSTVLAWIRRDINWSVFVANRIKEIRELTNIDQWRHVPGTLNPADLPSRGCTARQLLSSQWWEGPEWLRQVAESWPAGEGSMNEGEINAEIRKTTAKGASGITLLAIDKEQKPFYNSYSNFQKTLRIVSWIKRFIYNCKSRADERKRGNLTVNELENAEICVIKLIQKEAFADETDEHIRHFAPFKDENGLIRTKSKIVQRDDTFNFRCPIILPASHDLVKLIIKSKHEELNHAGVLVMLNVLREKFWITGGRKTIRSVISKCLNCRRFEAKPLDTNVPPLPLNRIKDAAIFEVIGIDFAGPIYLKKREKAWICLFTCAVYRAVHLELVNSLSTASLLMALRRHIARRGRPVVIYSDCGTNFVGLNNAFKSIDFEKINKVMATQQIEWIFNPPAAPWWGGFWERLIGILKRLLRRTLKKACLDYEEMLTTLVDCEAVINSRPITFVSDAKEDLIPLSPSMFLQEIKEVGTIDLDNIEKVQLNKRFLYRQKIKQELRKRFRSEYLGALTYTKGKNIKHNKIRVGDIVLIGHDNQKRLDWPLARVKELICGNDGKVRVVKLVTATGEMTLPIQRLFPLELNCNDRDMCVNKNLQVNKEAYIIIDGYVSSDEKQDVTKPHVITRSGRISKKPERLGY